MSLIIASINSGSNGNCYYIGNQYDAVFIDAGISCREIEKRMLRLNLDIKKIRAIVVSHEHSDHIKGVPVLSKKYNLPVYISEKTLNSSRMILPNSISFLNNQQLTIESLTIHPFSKLHDAADPFSFTISFEELTVGVFTDIGTVCSSLVNHFKRCHAAFLEANYDEEMLEHGRYPYFLKNRIRNGKGHLSNDKAFNLFKEHKASFLQLLLLSHLSKDNNDPIKAKSLFDSTASTTEIVVASRNEESRAYEINAAISKSLPMQHSYQLSLF